jgi:hypothetical protein
MPYRNLLVSEKSYTCSPASWSNRHTRKSCIKPQLTNTLRHLYQRECHKLRTQIVVYSRRLSNFNSGSLSPDQHRSQLVANFLLVE